MLNLTYLNQLGLQFLEKYIFDDKHYSFVFKQNNLCVIIDNNICNNDNSKPFDYSNYCNMQNKYMYSFDKLYRFNYTDDTIYDKINEWINKKPDDIIIDDKEGSRNLSHIDNTPAEEHFEKLFVEAYGNEALFYLKKEYSFSLNDGKNGFIDYVVETKNGNYAIEANGISYHHPCIIGNKAYSLQLEKQNTLSLFGFKIFRFSTEDFQNEGQTIDSIKYCLGNKENFIDSTLVKADRKFKLYDHQEKILENINQSRNDGINTFLVVIPTGTGKSQIVIEDLKNLINLHLIKKVLIMVPSNMIKNDWLKRIKSLNQSVLIDVECYNTAFIRKNNLEKEYYDYIVFDEAHHAQAANCKKTLQYFNPKYLIGLTATPDRLDKKKITEIFGQYETHLSLKEAVEKHLIANIRCYRLESNIDLSYIRYNGIDYNTGDLEKLVSIDSRNELIAKTIKKYFSPRKDFFKQGIIFCVNTEHCNKLEKILTNYGIKAKAVHSKNKSYAKSFEDYQNKKIQFLLSCQLISEGWDSPQTEIVVMARPTLSKILYLQQIGRGTRNYPNKECLYVIDVVDNYASQFTPWTFNSLFNIGYYSDFMGIINNNIDYLNVFGLSETEISMKEIDIFTFEEKYKDYKSLEQAARLLFIGTYTLSKWVKKNSDYASLYLTIGNKKVPYFNNDDIEKIKKDKKITNHTEETILQDFIDFIDKNNTTRSYKLVFLLGMFKLSDNEGNVNVDDLIANYRSFYLDRLKRNLPVDRKDCKYNEKFLNDYKKIKNSIFTYPFEKYERKRFIVYSEDLNIISFNRYLWTQLTDDLKKELIQKEKTFLEEYYKDLGGL